jgi:hypothetical protein
MSSRIENGEVGQAGELKFQQTLRLVVTNPNIPLRSRLEKAILMPTLQYGCLLDGDAEIAKKASASAAEFIVRNEPKTFSEIERIILQSFASAGYKGMAWFAGHVNRNIRQYIRLAFGGSI